MLQWKHIHHDAAQNYAVKLLTCLELKFLIIKKYVYQGVGSFRRTDVRSSEAAVGELQTQHGHKVAELK